MKYKLVLDFGNTLKKIAVFQGDHQVDYRTSEGDVVGAVEELKKQYPLIQSAILSSVVKIDLHTMTYLKINFRFILFDHQLPIPIENKYQSPETLGRDRIAAAVGAYLLFPNKNVLVVDAGSSITYEMLTKESAYLGGAISPGLNMRAKALNTFTDLLPLVECSKDVALIGIDTDTSLKSGVVNGAIAEVNGMITSFSEEFDNLQIILTGGDAYYFEKRLNYDIFASGNLVLKGLNYILDYNEH